MTRGGAYTMVRRTLIAMAFQTCSDQCFTGPGPIRVWFGLLSRRRSAGVRSSSGRPTASKRKQQAAPFCVML
jgi:hypothetical protein